MLCLRCLAAREDPAAEVFELLEGRCSRCGRYGPAAADVAWAPAPAEGQPALFAAD